MMQTFYQQKPAMDTPYRQLLLECTNGWQVQLLGGTKWGRENAEELKVVKVLDYDAGVQEYDKIFGELRAQGWKPYNPFVPW
jgi:hypothetical protein